MSMVPTVCDHVMGSHQSPLKLCGKDRSSAQCAQYPPFFYSLAEAKIIIEAWQRYYNTERPHSSLGYKPPAPEASDSALLFNGFFNFRILQTCTRNPQS